MGKKKKRANICGECGNVVVGSFTSALYANAKGSRKFIKICTSCTDKNKTKK